MCYPSLFSSNSTFYDTENSFLFTACILVVFQEDNIVYTYLPLFLTSQKERTEIHYHNR
jgi:hypothetical protein